MYVLLGIGLLAAIWLVWLLYGARAKQITGVPVADGFIPYFGHTFQTAKLFMDNKKWLLWNLEQSLKAKTHYTISSLNKPPMLRILTAEAAKHILEDNFDNYVKIDSPGVKLYGVEFFGDGIFQADGEEWRFHRKAASYMFSTNVLRSMVDVFNEHGETMVGVLEKYAGNENPVDMQDIFQRFTMDSICRIAFGVHFDSLHLPQGTKPAFSQAFDYIQTCINLRFIKPFTIFKLDRQFQISKTERDLTECARVLDQTILDVLESRKQELQDERAGSKWQDLLSQFVKMARDRNETLDTRFIRDVVMNFIIAGRDTTACLLSWTLFELDKRPDIYEKVISEIGNVLKGNPPNYDNVKELTYTENVLLEILRLHPPVPMDAKRCISDDKLPDGTLVPKGTMVSYSPWLFGRLPWLWDEPEEFRPERWEGERHSDYKFITFNAGPRLCLGKRMALVEAKVVLCILLTRFRFRISPGQTDETAVSIIHWLKHGLKMTINTI
mmetsp:Transcript_24290/g.68051  ORF Transcript_24290/g.68051 Transcript_24290/m.68051 type:complete len:497 (+) Transcript_24290:44-1534(+)